MNTRLKTTFVTVSIALAAMLSSTAVALAGSCMSSGGASQSLLDAARDNPASLLSSYGSKDAMSDAIRLLVATDTALAAKVIAAAHAPGASADQKAGIGAGLARASKVCEPQHPDLAQEILDEVAKLEKTDPVQVAFQSGLNQFSIASTTTPAPVTTTAPGLGGTSGSGGGGGGGSNEGSGSGGSQQGVGGGLRSNASGGGAGRSTSSSNDSQSGSQT